MSSRPESDGVVLRSVDWNKQADTCVSVCRGDGKVWWTLCAKAPFSPEECCWCGASEARRKLSQFSEIASERGGLTLLNRLRVCSVWAYVTLAEWSCRMEPRCSRSRCAFQTRIPLRRPQACTEQAWVVSATDKTWILTSGCNLI